MNKTSYIPEKFYSTIHIILYIKVMNVREVVPQEETNIKSILEIILISFEFIFIRKPIVTQERMIYLLTR